ncbi:MAG: hypothetical protein ACRCUS_06625 [Anaerovoracaceae bacterium]
MKNVSKKWKIYLMILLLIYFIIRSYFFGVQIDTLEGTQATELLNILILLGLFSAICGIVLCNIKRIPIIIKHGLIISTILLFIASILFNPNWEKIQKEQVENSKVQIEHKIN